MRRVLVPVSLAVLVALVGVACDDGDETTSVTSAPTTSSTSVPDGEAAEECTAPEGIEAAESAGTEDESAEAEGGLAFITRVEHSPTPCFQEVRFTFEPESPGTAVGYEIGYERGPFADASGKTASVEGEVFLRVVFLNGTAVDLSSEVPRETYRGEPGVSPDQPVVDIVKVSDFEGVSEWVIGLTEKLPFDLGGQIDRGVPPEVDEFGETFLAVLIYTA